ncbi:hypothetical protein Tco_0880573 [Tanacetum coccineum]
MMLSNPRVTKLKGQEIEFSGVSRHRDLYFVKFIINPEEDDFIPGVILGRSFQRLSCGIVDFGNGVITIYPELDPFEDDSEKTGKSSDDWDQLLDFNFDDVPKSREELSPFICKMGKSNRNKKRAMENFNLFYQEVGPSVSAGRHLTQEEAAKEELAIRISQRYALLEEERPVIETMAYNDKYKMILDEIWKDKVELDGKTVKEDEEAVKRIKGEALKEKEDPGAFIFPIRLEGKVNKNALADTGSDINTMPYRIFEKIGREDTKKVDRRKIMIYHTQTKAMGKLSNILCQVGVTTIIAKTVESDTDDEEEYVIKRNKFGAPIYGPRPALYLNCANPEDRSSARSEKLVFGRKQLTSLEHTTEKSDHHDPNAQEMKPWKSYCFHKFTMSFYYGKDVPEMLSLEAKSRKEDINFVTWIRAFNINEPIYAELCHEFYSTYGFDEACADDELQSKNIIKV